MANSDRMTPFGAHRECWDLLPWVANESIGARELARVEAHLRDCRQCQEELEVQRQLRSAIRADESIVLAPQTSLQKLMQRINGVEEDDVSDASASRAGAQRTSAAAVSPIKRPLRPARWLAIAAAVQGIAIAGLLAALGWQSRERLAEPRFTMLTTQTAVARGPVIRVVFAGGTALEDINRVLRSIDAQIVAGPSESGVYTLGLAAGASRPPNIEQAVMQLRADSRVMFAESAVATESP